MWIKLFKKRYTGKIPTAFNNSKDSVLILTNEVPSPVL
jgi:hypothetical protein